MSDETRAVLQSALALPEEARGELIECLVRSLSAPPSFVEMDDETFAAEIERRCREADADPDGGMTWDELKKMT